MKKQAVCRSPCKAQVPGSGHTCQPGPWHLAQSSYLQQDPSHISLSVFSVELAQQELCREPLCHKVGHAVAIIAIEDPIQEAVVFTSSRGRAGGGLKPGTCRWWKKEERNWGGTKGREGFRHSSGSPHCGYHFTIHMTCF